VERPHVRLDPLLAEQTSPVGRPIASVNSYTQHLQVTAN